jgi:four helix bundle protein
VATIKKTEDLVVWMKSRILCKKVHRFTKREPFSRDFKLVDQINASSGSIMDNIAEGFGRKGNREFIQFLNIAHGSLMEVKSQVYRAHDRDYISDNDLSEMLEVIHEIGSMIHALSNYLNRSAFRGQKFKPRNDAEEL